MKIIEQIKEIKIIGIELRADNEKAFDEIPAFWGTFYREGVLPKIPGKLSESIYAVYTNFAHPGKDNNGTYSLIIGAEVGDLDKIPSTFASTIIQPFKRAVFEVDVPEKVGSKWMEIWNNKTILPT